MRLYLDSGVKDIKASKDEFTEETYNIVEATESGPYIILDNPWNIEICGGIHLGLQSKKSPVVSHKYVEIRTSFYDKTAIALVKDMNATSYRNLIGGKIVAFRFKGSANIFGFSP